MEVASELTRPLVVFTPKSLLRAKHAMSSKADCPEWTFPRGHRGDKVNQADVKTVLLCSGKRSTTTSSRIERIPAPTMSPSFR